MEEVMDNTRLNIVIGKDLRIKVKMKAAKEEKTLREVVVDLLEKWLKK